jgi:hypothetical protein
MPGAVVVGNFHARPAEIKVGAYEQRVTHNLDVRNKIRKKEEGKNKNKKGRHQQDNNM